MIFAFKDIDMPVMDGFFESDEVTAGNGKMPNEHGPWAAHLDVMESKPCNIPRPLFQGSR